MRRYIVKRLLFMILTILILLTVSYFALSFAIMKKYTELPLNDYFRTTWLRYLIYIRRILFQWDFGVSGRHDTPTMELLVKYLGISLKMNVVAFLIYVPLGIIIGVLTGMYDNTWFDRISTNLLLIVNSVPIYILMFLLIFYVGYHLKIGHYQYVEGWGARNYILPVFALTLAPISRLSRVVRSEMIESKHSDYILLARVKGMSVKRALLRHSTRHSISAVVQALPDAFLFALMGSVFVEIIYRIPGVAVLLIMSLVRVSPVGGLYIFIELEMVMVILLFYSVLSIGMNIIADILLGYIDPRIRYE